MTQFAHEPVGACLRLCAFTPTGCADTSTRDNFPLAPGYVAVQGADAIAGVSLQDINIFLAICEGPRPSDLEEVGALIKPTDDGPGEVTELWMVMGQYDGNPDAEVIRII